MTIKKPPQTTKHARGMSIGQKQFGMTFRGTINLKTVGVTSQSKGIATSRPSLADLLTSSKSLSPNKIKKRGVPDQTKDIKT